MLNVFFFLELFLLLCLFTIFVKGLKHSFALVIFDRTKIDIEICGTW